MDYDELKDKYGQRLESGQKIPVKIIAIVIVIIAVVAAAYYSWTSGMFVMQSAPDKVMSEIVSVNAQNDTTTLVGSEMCSRIEKSDTEWTISGCKDNIDIHLTFYTGEYVMKICGGWADGQAVAKSSSVLTYLDILKPSCDVNSISLLRAEGGTNVYNVCGRRLYLKEGCIV